MSGFPHFVDNDECTDPLYPNTCQANSYCLNSPAGSYQVKRELTFTIH